MDGQVNANSFAFPMHYQQVFFSDDPHRRGWKVVCRTEVRGRRGQLYVSEPTAVVINMGNDDDFHGLHPPVRAEDPRRAAPNDVGAFVGVNGHNVLEEQEHEEAL